MILWKPSEFHQLHTPKKMGGIRIFIHFTKMQGIYLGHKQTTLKSQVIEIITV